MDVIIEVLCDDSKIYVACCFPVWLCLCLCDSSINLYLNYFSRKTENPRLPWASPWPNQAHARCLWSLVIAELSPQSSELVLIWKRFRCLTKKSHSVLCLSSSPVRSSRGIWSTANRLFGASMSTCKTRSQAHGLQTRPYTFSFPGSLAGKHQYSSTQ
jgi:hypothetical protein